MAYTAQAVVCIGLHVVLLLIHIILFLLLALLPGFRNGRYYISLLGTVLLTPGVALFSTVRNIQFTATQADEVCLHQAL